MAFRKRNSVHKYRKCQKCWRQFKRKVSHILVPQRSNNHRSKLLQSDGIFCLAVVLIGAFSLIQSLRFFPGLNYSILGFSSDITIEKVVAQTNQQRLKTGLRPLVLNDKLTAAALAKAQDMFDNQYWSHTSPKGREPWDFIRESGYTYKVAGENLARDFHLTTEMIDAWMTSPTHRGNILNDKYDQIGVAVVEGRLDNFDTVLVVQMFGTPQVQPAQLGDQAATEENYHPFVADQASVTGLGQEVLAGAMVPVGNLTKSALFTPVFLTKMLFILVVILILGTLAYDSAVIKNKKTMRMAGENLGHVILFCCVAFLVILFKGGVIK